MAVTLNSIVASAPAGATTPPSGDADSAPASDGMKGVLDDEQRTTEEEQRQLLLDRQAFDLANEERSEIMREEDALRDMLMAELKNEDAYLKKWIELI